MVEYNIFRWKIDKIGGLWWSENPITILVSGDSEKAEKTEVSRAVDYNSGTNEWKIVWWNC